MTTQSIIQILTTATNNTETKRRVVLNRHISYTTVTWERAQVVPEVRNGYQMHFQTTILKTIFLNTLPSKYSSHFTTNYSGWKVWRIGSENQVPIFRTSSEVTQPLIRLARGLFIGFNITGSWRWQPSCSQYKDLVLYCQDPKQRVNVKLHGTVRNPCRTMFRIYCN
jgi:hypothetical protein